MLILELYSGNQHYYTQKKQSTVFIYDLQTLSVMCFNRGCMFVILTMAHKQGYSHLLTVLVDLETSYFYNMGHLCENLVLIRYAQKPPKIPVVVYLLRLQVSFMREGKALVRLYTRIQDLYLEFSAHIGAYIEAYNMKPNI